MKRTVAGFTLIELVIVVAIIAILLTIAIPSFMDQMRRSRRAEAIAGLQQMQMAQERWRSGSPTYCGPATSPACPHATMVAASTENYTFAISNTSATGYTLTATRAGAQTADTACPNYTITQAANSGTDTGVRITKTPDPLTTNCWK